MTKQELKTAIVNDLGANYDSTDSGVVDSILDDVINDALLISNRFNKAQASEEAMAKHLAVLSSDIKQCVKTLYLRRGSEDVKQQSQSGLSGTFDNANQTMRDSIIRSGKRLLF